MEEEVAERVPRIAVVPVKVEVKRLLEVAPVATNDVAERLVEVELVMTEFVPVKLVELRLVEVAPVATSEMTPRFVVVALVKVTFTKVEVAVEVAMTFPVRN